MQRVTGAIGFSVSPATWAAAVIVVAGWIAGALLIAQHIASTPRAAVPQEAVASPEPSQTPNRAAKASLDPSWPVAARQAPQDEAARPVASRQAPQDEASAPETQPQAPHAEDANGRTETGRASWYDLAANTANGEAMDGATLTAAHPTLPFGSKVKVTNLANGRTVVVRVNDRGPFTKGRIIDVSRAAAEKLGMLSAGTARVSITPVADAASGDKVASASEEHPLQR